MAEQIKPRLWSDFDGTGVEILSKGNPRNWSKYPLRQIEGYLSFLEGVQDGGVDIAGIVSRRPNILPRRIATARSVAKLGMDTYFPGKHQVILAGSEEAKAKVIVNESQKYAVGMIDDKPHNLGRSLLRALRVDESNTTGKEIVLGAIAHPKTEKHMAELAHWASGWASSEYRGADVAIEHGALRVTDRGGSFNLQVVQVAPYSHESGRSFAEILTNIS